MPNPAIASQCRRRALIERMKTQRALIRWLCLGLLGVAASVARAELLINEILFNPPFGDTTNELVELRGTPNLVIPDGTYLVSVEGDGGNNPGAIQNVFDLSGRRVGQNGFLLLLQKFHRYKPNPLSMVVTNSDSGEGWGSGSSSSLEHQGEGGQLELENASCTFLLIQSSVEPAIGDDMDGNDDGIPDGVFTNWVVLDSVGALDNSGAGDFAYGRINFRSDKPPGDGATVAAGAVVPVPFTPGYVGRNGNTTDWEGTNWVASDNLPGKPPSLFLGGNSASAGTNTFPYKRSKAALNHFGGPNFKAPVLPSVILRETKTKTIVSESGLKDYYTLNLSLRATGAVTIQIEAELPVQVSTNGGKTYGTQGVLTLSSTSAKKVLVRALDDGMAGPAQQTALITHAVVHSLDPRYPTNTIILPAAVTVLDTNVVLLSEAKVNPPGEDAPFEFVELRGPPGKLITNLFLVGIDGDETGNPGQAGLVANLTGQRFGTNGLLMVAAPGHPYLFPSNTTVLPAPPLAGAGGALGNGSVSLLLVGARAPIVEGTDLDAGDNGTLEGLPFGAFIVDAIAWFRANKGGGDEIYGGVDLTQAGFTPDAATRFPWNRTPRSASAWFVGDLAGGAGDSLSYSSISISTNVPPGSVMSPGVVNRKAPRLTPNPLPARSGVIGDPDNETVSFALSVLEDDDDNFESDDDPDDYVPATSLTVTVASDNQTVVPDANLTLTNVAPGRWRLSIEPVGAGYALITIRATDGIYTRLGFVEYGASAQGRPGAKWHTSVSDASTAIAIDANWMFVGDDENQVLRIYSRTRSGGPVGGKDLSPLLSLVDFYEDGSPKEVDIEGSTRVGNRIYWVGSLSHAFNATERTNRSRLFATDLSGSGTNAQLKLLSHYDFLKLDLLSWDAGNRHGKGANYYGLADSAAIGVDPKSPDGSGFNIEGLCLAPGPNNTTNLYIAFRAPLVPPTGTNARTMALVLPVLNFGKIATKRSGPGSAQFGPPIELNLGGRGVRSIEGAGGTNYLIVAGPPGAGASLPPPGNFKLFTWTGQPADPPREHAADLTGLNPEGIVEVPAGVWTPTNLFQIISDNGTNIYYGDDIQAKHLETEGKPGAFKKFRVDSIALGDAVPSAPLIRFVAASGDGVTVNWFSTAGTTYRLQMKSSLNTDWSDLPGDVTATGAATSKTLAPAPVAQCFFRVVAVH
jgi:hypothetical protein